jgi:hypothetical protein
MIKRQVFTVLAIALAGVVGPAQQSDYLQKTKDRSAGTVSYEWLVGRWNCTWKQAQGKGDVHPALDQLCCLAVFPYVAFVTDAAKPLEIACEMRYRDPNGQEFRLTQSGPISIVTSNMLYIGTSYSWLFGYEHMARSDGDVLTLASTNTGQGTVFHAKFTKVSNDPGEPRISVDQWRDQEFPDWRRFDRAYREKNGLPVPRE